MSGAHLDVRVGDLDVYPQSNYSSHRPPIYQDAKLYIIFLLY